MAELTTMRPGSSPKPAVDTKILGDLNTLTEKMDLCDSMLHPGAGDAKLSVKSSEAMLAVVGFLEACAPRMVELVEAAAQGALSEDVFAQCLAVNDRLQKLLADVETAAMTETTAVTTAASAPSVSNNEGADVGEVGKVADDFKDLLLDDDHDIFSTQKPSAAVLLGEGGGNAKTTGEEDDDIFGSQKKPPPATSAAAAAPTAGAKTTGEEDLFNISDTDDAKLAAATATAPAPVLQPPPSATADEIGGGGVIQTSSNDEFDDFFNERTTANAPN